MDRRRFLVTSLAGVLAAPLAADGQQTGKAYTIGLLSSGPGLDPRYTPIFFNALRDHGYELGRNLAVEPRFAAGKVEQLPELAADPVRRKVDIIVASGSSRRWWP
jgi:putative tryptophan/tyrosine transport system substrate-binding protein